jgi:hypothetical protein
VKLRSQLPPLFFVASFARVFEGVDDCSPPLIGRRTTFEGIYLYNPEIFATLHSQKKFAFGHSASPDLEGGKLIARRRR